MILGGIWVLPTAGWQCCHIGWINIGTWVSGRKMKKKKKVELVPQVLSVAKEWCAYCQFKSRVKRKELEGMEFEFWECKKCKLIEEFRK